MDTNPGDARKVNNLGVIRLDNLKDPQGAIPHFERAIAPGARLAEAGPPAEGDEETQQALGYIDSEQVPR